MRITRILALTLALIVIGAPSVALPSDQEQAAPYVVTAWQMPSWAGYTTPTWAQSYATSVETTTKNLSALDSWLAAPAQCGKFYQVDGYLNNSVTATLLEGGVLYGPGNPQEALWGGGWGVAYTLVQTPACVVEPPVVEPPVVEPPVVEPPVVEPPVVEPPVVEPPVTATPATPVLQPPLFTG